LKKQYKILIISYFIPFFLITIISILSISSIQYLKDFQVKSQQSLFLWKQVTSTAQMRFYFNVEISNDEWNETLTAFEISVNELEQDLNPLIFARNIPLLKETHDLWLFTKDLLVETNIKFEKLIETPLGKVLSESNFQDLVLNAYYEKNEDLLISDYYPFHLLSALNSDLLIMLNYISSEKLFENKLVDLSNAINNTVDWAVKLLIIFIVVICLIIVLSAVLFIREYQAELGRNEDHLSLILNSIGDAMIVVSVDSSIQKMNPIAQEITGWSLDDAQGKDLYDVFNIYEPSSGEKSEDLVKKVVRTKGILNSIDKTLLNLEENEFRSISISAAPVVNNETKIEAVVLIFRDISTRKKQEEEIDHLRYYLTNIIDSMPSALVGIDGEKNITLWSGSFMD
jgi:PAS domain S-box-containing protein